MALQSKRPLTVVFCLPGSSFSGRFVQCWTNLLAWCLGNSIRPVLSQRYSCNIYYVRNMCLGADVSRGKDQKPFDGKLDYDYIMWIDSDILFTPEQFARLLSHDKEIVAGLYLMQGGSAYAAVLEWDEDYFAKHGHFRFLTPEDLATNPQPGSGHPGWKDVRDENQTSPNPQSTIRNPQLVGVAYAGMGFMLVKYGVFEGMEYPWFRPIQKRIGDMVDYTMEDVAFCLRAREMGYRVLADPGVKVRHEKGQVL